MNRSLESNGPAAQEAETGLTAHRSVTSQIRGYVAAEWIEPILRRHFWLPYLVGRFRGKLLARVHGDSASSSAVFLVHERNRGWVLEAICREIALRYPGKRTFHYSAKRLPRARDFFVSHYSMLPTAFKENLHLYESNVYVWYTHPRPIDVSEEEIVYCLNLARKVFCPNSWLVEYLASRGVRRGKLVTVLGAADPNTFEFHARGNGAIGFSMAFYERKEPQRVIDIAKAFGERRILLLGRGWKEWNRFQELISLPNLTYVEASYADYPSYYAQMDVFVSPALLEGGPVPLLEAMMSNAVPVASDTGFARDIIHPGENGYIFDVDAPLSTITTLIEEALSNSSDVRATVEHLSWDRFGKEITSYMTAQAAAR